MTLKHIFCAVAMTAALSTQAQSHVFDVKAAKPGAPVQSTMYGIFFEDINYAADGGLYAELVMNRSFEFPNALRTTVPLNAIHTTHVWLRRVTATSTP